jgi:hypothetical protein
MDAINYSKTYQIDDKCHNVSGQTRDQTSVTSPIMLLLLGLGLASQEVDVLAKSTNENSWNLYGYDKMTQPQLLVQTQV